MNSTYSYQRRTVEALRHTMASIGVASALQMRHVDMRLKSRDRLTTPQVQAKIEAIEKDAKKRVTRFSIAGYSLGGLISRYLIGSASRFILNYDHTQETYSCLRILHSRNFFDAVKPVNFTTFATPHIGLPKYPTWISKIMASVGPKLLSKTGEQFYCIDSYSSTGKPLLQVMADPSASSP